MRLGEDRGVHRELVGKPEGKRSLGRPRRRWEDNIKCTVQCSVLYTAVYCTLHCTLHYSVLYTTVYIYSVISLSLSLSRTYESKGF